MRKVLSFIISFCLKNFLYVGLLVTDSLVFSRENFFSLLYWRWIVFSDIEFTSSISFWQDSCSVQGKNELNLGSFLFWIGDWRILGLGHLVLLDGESQDSFPLHFSSSFRSLCSLPSSFYLTEPSFGCLLTSVVGCVVVLSREESVPSCLEKKTSCIFLLFLTLQFRFFSLVISLVGFSLVFRFSICEIYPSVIQSLIAWEAFYN